MARGGFPGGFGGINMNQIMKQAKKMQEEMEKSQENLASQTFESTTGGGAVYAKVNGSKELIEIKIQKDVVDPDDVEMLQDLIMVAINDAISQADKFNEENMGKLTGGINIPGLM